MKPRDKLFKDPVHGYISVPEEWCVDWIDTPIFQRLRNIEQTSMRPLYPAAHHDRFIHSLGTYHLGKQLLAHIESNTEDDDIREFLNNDSLRNTFLIACLMHDCGHAPFSHTFEGFYNFTNAKTSQGAYELLAEEFPGQDFKVEGSFDPAPHEALSAVVLKRFYSAQLRKYQCDPELSARMITGCTYPNESNFEIAVHNCLIELLNGNAIDADKLDYILRDTWASGVKNTAIDIDRLVSGVMFQRDVNGKIRLCYRKSALSVLQSVVDARNYLYEWVYNHHTVLYYSQLLDRSLRKLAQHLGKDSDPDFFWKAAFSLEPFNGLVDLGQGLFLRLPTDGDMLHLLKRFSNDIPLPELDELLSHCPSRVALWKTSAEFRMIFKGNSAADSSCCKNIANRLPGLIAEELGCQEDDVIVITALEKHYSIEEGHVQVQTDQGVKPFTEVMGEGSRRNPVNFFYVYVLETYKERKQDIIHLIRNTRR